MGKNKTTSKPKAAKALSAGTSLKFPTEVLTQDRPPEPTPKLRDAIKASYGDKNGIEALEGSGYKRDPILSSHNQSVFYNERTGKLLYNIAGTHNARDALTDVHLFFGNLKGTSRYKEAKDIYEQAKKKYNVSGDNISVVGHSLGGSLASAVTDRDKGVHVTTYNKGVGLGGLFGGSGGSSKGFAGLPTGSGLGGALAGSLFGRETNHAGEKAYRSRGDIVSLLGMNKKGTTSIGKVNLNPLEAHPSDNLKNLPLFV